MKVRSIVAGSHSHPAAYDAGLYLLARYPHLCTSFTVEASSPGMWNLIIDDDLDSKGSLTQTGEICETARAFITGRGGMCMPLDPKLPTRKE